jgi:hypothetical protein
MTAPTHLCTDCGAREADDLHLARCAHRRHVTRLLLDRAAARGVVDERAVTDLAGVLGAFTTDFERAAVLARCVIELGWRPTVGAS